MAQVNLGHVVGPGVPTGGTAGQVLVKNGATNFDTSWQNLNQNAAIENVQDGLAIVANGNTHAAIASGQFVYVKNHGTLAEGLYRATAAIGTNAALSTSNLTADGAGGLNALKSDVDALNSNIDLPITLLSDLTASIGIVNYSIKMGRIVLISIILNNTSGAEWPQGGGAAQLTDVGAVPRPAYRSGEAPGDTSSIIDIVNRTGGRVRVRKDGTLLGQNIATGAQTFTGMYISE